VVCLQIKYVEKNARPGAVKFFRTQSPRHFEGGDWDQGGSCLRDRPLSIEQVVDLVNYLFKHVFTRTVIQQVT